MTLLDLLRELEPDAGWRRGHRGSGIVDAAFTEASRVNVFPCATTIPFSVRVVIFDANIRAKAWKKCEIHAPDLRTALKMALTGYRAGETR